MRVTLRISRGLYEHVLNDLRRPHAFAAERIGFLSTKLGRVSESELLVFMTEYQPVEDDLYIEDFSVGARINSEAIRRGMQTVVETGRGLYHVHLHDWSGVPSPSYTDRQEIPPLVKSFHNVSREGVPHGLIIFSKDKAVAFTSIAKQSELAVASRISVVGHPLTFLDGDL